VILLLVMDPVILRGDPSKLVLLVSTKPRLSIVCELCKAWINEDVLSGNAEELTIALLKVMAA
jgi:hypothetical protein